MTKFQKWEEKYFVGYENSPTKDAWNAACNSILRMIKTRNKEFEGNWQHEDIDFLMYDIKKMLEK